MAHSIKYQITRAVVAGYTIGAQHVFSPPLRDKDPKRTSHSRRSTSMGGVTYTTYYYGSTSWDAETTPVNATYLALLDMFLQSVEDGQVFTFDPYYAAGASPSDVRNVILDTTSYAPTRKVRRGNGGAGDLYTLSFKMLEVP